MRLSVGPEYPWFGAQGRISVPALVRPALLLTYKLTPRMAYSSTRGNTLICMSQNRSAEGVDV